MDTSQCTANHLGIPRTFPRSSPCIHNTLEKSRSLELQIPSSVGTAWGLQWQLICERPKTASLWIDDQSLCTVHQWRAQVHLSRPSHSGTHHLRCKHHLLSKRRLRRQKSHRGGSTSCPCSTLSQKKSVRERRNQSRPHRFLRRCHLRGHTHVLRSHRRSKLRALRSRHQLWKSLTETHSHTQCTAIAGRAASHTHLQHRTHFLRIAILHTCNSCNRRLEILGLHCVVRTTVPATTFLDRRFDQA